MKDSTTVREFFSLDIETTSLDEANAKIWSVGIAGPQESEDFIQRYQLKDGLPASKEGIREYLMTNKFQESQKEELSAWFNAGKNRNQSSITSSMNRLLDIARGNSALIIQNVNFENKMIAEVFRREPELRNSLAELMMEQPVHNDFVDRNKLLYTPLEITAKRQEARDLKGMGQLDKSIAANIEVMEMYRSLSKTKDTGMYTIELMDITRGVYAKAAEKGYLPKEMGAHGSLGLKVDFLTQLLFKEKETHGALSDAKHQVRIFDKMNHLYDAMNHDSMTKSDINIFNNLIRASPMLANEQLLSSVSRGLEEHFSSSGYALLELRHQEKTIVQSISNKNGNIIEKTINTTSNAPIASTRQQVLDSIRDRNPSATNTDSVFEAIRNMTGDERNEYIDSEKAKVKESIYSKASGDKNTLLDPVENGIRKFRNTSKKTKASLAIGAAALTLGTLSLGGDSEAKQKRQERSLKENKEYNEHSFRMFSPEIYHGTGFYLWENAIGHHTY